ncbi:MAG: hypothetical protein JG778_367 [Thermodesulfobacterium sp.]|jgi:hypothetical protein|nr:hypothetical protein [Thermodesulfobacterium sp.]
MVSYLLFWVIKFDFFYFLFLNTKFFVYLLPFEKSKDSTYKALKLVIG